MKPSDFSIYERYKKIYDQTYTISLCREEEIGDVIRFIDNYWKKNHILVQSKILLDWQYYNINTHTYNFVIARNKETNEIHAIEGFIPTTQFDHSINNAMTWGAIWKAIPDIAPPGLGFVVKKYRETEFISKYACEVGISPDAEKYNKQFHNTVFSLNNWVMINPCITHYKLIDFNPLYLRNVSICDYEVKSTTVNSDQWLEMTSDVETPEYKSKDYYLNRYFRHPIYTYHSIMIEDCITQEKGFIFYRYAAHNESCCIFIVDYLGGSIVLSKAGKVFLEILKKSNAEYILFPNYGIQESYMVNAGFICYKDDEATIPMYYEPFLKKNIRIICATPKQTVDWRVFKGDSDQDRPNS